MRGSSDGNELQFYGPADGSQLGPRLFKAEERWGWELVAREKPIPSFEANRPPIRQQVDVPVNFAELKENSRRAWWVLIRHGVVMISVVVVVALSSPDKVWNAAFIFIAGFGLIFGRFLWVRNKFRSAKAKYEAQFNGTEFAQLYAAWQRRVAKHDEKEAARVAARMYWNPLGLASRHSRIDVFGGTSDGWASLLTTVGASLMAQDAAMMVVDFTEHAVVGGLVNMAIAEGHPVEIRELPECLHKVNIFDGLSPTDIAELVSEAIHVLHSTLTSPDLRALHSNWILIVAESLEKPATFTRLLAGLQVLQRVYEFGPEMALTESEFRVLNSAVDTIGSTDQVRNGLLTLASAIGTLAREEGTRVTDAADWEGFGAVWPARGLSVVATRGLPQLKKLLDLVVFQRTLCEVRVQGSTGNQLLVVAGADHMGLDSLEAMAKQARNAGVRLLLLMEHLRDDLQRLLGGADSATFIMRLGNATEAANAADFIGRGYKFVLSQFTEQTGYAFASGDAYGQGGAGGYTRDGGFSVGSQGAAGISIWGSDLAATRTRTDNWQKTVNVSATFSKNTGNTFSRAYEYTVEPTTIQGLAPTAFFMVEVVPFGRRVVAGDCNPSIVLLDRVAIKNYST